MREDLVLNTLVMLLDTSPHSPHLANLEKYDYVLHLKNFFVKRVFIVNLKQKFCIDRKLFELIIFLVSCHDVNLYLMCGRIHNLPRITAHAQAVLLKVLTSTSYLMVPEQTVTVFMHKLKWMLSSFKKI